ncbi:hypothetical protein [Mesorhizobium sp. CN2-181]|uniref:hypothetical protein n=1 Tax=Mesorhizobium yinganensis TaxID=3157707 RepID=UPI0032B7EA28
MTDDEHHKPAKLETEFRRQMRSGQMARFVGTLPLYSVQHDMPDRFSKLLRQIDRLPNEDAGAMRGAHKARN